MAKFEDNNKREWEINLDGPTIIDVRARCNGLNLVSTDGSAFEKLSEDSVLLGTVMWVLCEEQAKAAQIDPKAFAKAIVGDAIDRATQCLIEAVCDFSPKRTRTVLKALSESNDRLRDRAIQEALSRLGSKDLEDKAVKALADRMDDEFHKALTRQSSATSALAAVESDPTA